MCDIPVIYMGFLKLFVGVICDTGQRLNKHLV